METASKTSFDRTNICEGFMTGYELVEHIMGTVVEGEVQGNKMKNGSRTI